MHQIDTLLPKKTYSFILDTLEAVLRIHLRKVEKWDQPNAHQRKLFIWFFISFVILRKKFLEKNRQLKLKIFNCNPTYKEFKLSRRWRMAILNPFKLSELKDTIITNQMGRTIKDTSKNIFGAFMKKQYMVVI